MYTSLGINRLLYSHPPKIVKDLESFLRDYGGRKVATDITDSAIPLLDFRFQEGDLILFGNENTGYMNKSLQSVPGMEYVDCSVIVPMLGENYPKPDRDRPVAPNHDLHPNLNVTGTVDIVLYTALAQLGYFRRFSFKNLG